MGGSESTPAPTTQSLADKPWRELKKQWGPEYSQELIDEVKEIKCNCKDVKKPGLLLLGPVQAGKSTFINSVFSVGKGRMVNKAYTGSALKSFTVSLSRYRGSSELKNFRFFDTMGIDDSSEEGFNVGDIINLIQGHIHDKYKFNPLGALTSEDHAYNPDPKPEDKIHCAVFVINALMLFHGTVSYHMRRKIHHLQYEIKKLRVPRVLIITKVDLLCPKVAEDICNIFRSTKVETTVKTASELFGIPVSNIHPVKNYEGEIDIDPLKNIPLLLALRQILYFASDYAEGDDPE